MDIKKSLDYYFFQAFLSQGISFMRVNFPSLRVIVETEGSIRKMQKRALFHYKNKEKLKRAPLIRPPPMEPLYIFS